ncbi:MAG: hypothetical protein VCB07_06075 [Gammaproteobacteria bacterium]
MGHRQLLRDEDHYDHIMLTLRPSRDLEQEAIRFHEHERATDAFRTIVFTDAERARRRV